MIRHPFERLTPVDQPPEDRAERRTVRHDEREVVQPRTRIRTQRCVGFVQQIDAEQPLFERAA